MRSPRHSIRDSRRAPPDEPEPSHRTPSPRHTGRRLRDGSRQARSGERHGRVARHDAPATVFDPRPQSARSGERHGRVARHDAPATVFDPRPQFSAERRAARQRRTTRCPGNRLPPTAPVQRGAASGTAALHDAMPRQPPSTHSPRPPPSGGPTPGRPTSTTMPASQRRAREPHLRCHAQPRAGRPRLSDMRVGSPSGPPIAPIE